MPGSDDRTDEGAAPRVDPAHASAWDLETTGLHDLPPIQQLTLVVRDLVRVLRDREPIYRDAVAALTAQTAAQTRAANARAEALSASRRIVLHHAALWVYCVVVLAWGVGGAVYVTGISVGDVRSLAPSLSWEEIPAGPGAEEAVQP